MPVDTTKLQHHVKVLSIHICLHKPTNQPWSSNSGCNEGDMRTNYHDQIHYQYYGRLNLIFINIWQINYFQNNKIYLPRELMSTSFINDDTV